MTQLRMAWIGCGGHSSTLLGEASRIPEIDLVAVCDFQTERARSAARRFGALAWYTDFQQMLDAERPDAVAVVGPPSMEVELGVAVLSQGYHLYVEKPIGRNSREAQPLVEAAQRSAKHTQVGFNQRHAPVMRLGKSLVEAPEFGAPTYMESRHWEPDQLRSVWGIADLHYAWLMLHGIHAVDMLRYVFGEVAEVYTRTATAGSAGSLVSLCRFENGSNGVLNLHSGATGSEQMFEAVGSLGRAVRVTDFSDVYYTSTDHWAPEVAGHVQQGRFLHRTYAVSRGDRVGWGTELRDFATALLAGEAPFPSILDGFRSTRLAEAIHASALIGKPVRVEEAPVIEV